MNTKKWYLSKTIRVAILQGVLGVVLVLETQYGATGIVVILKSFLDFALRLNTAQPIE